MELTPKQQTIGLINDSNKILITTHQNPDGDALGSVLALHLALKKLGKDVVSVVPAPSPKQYQFLPQLKQLTYDLSGTKDFIITLDLSRADIDRLGYKKIPEEKKLNIIITPAKGVFEESDVTFSSGSYKFDLVFVLDCPDLDRLGSVYDDNSALFFEAPVINLDHHPGNDYFGKVNWVDLTATSTSEIMVALLESLSRDKPLLDADIATALLAGIITDTGSFQNANTTPKSLTVAAQLVAAGGRQQEIVQHVYKTRPLSTLKLWGKILSSIHLEEQHRFVWSQVSAQDLEQVGATEAETSGVIDELLKTAPNIDFALLLSERKGELHGSLRGAEKGVNVAEVAKLVGGGGHELAAAFTLPNTDLHKSREEVIEKIRRFQAKRVPTASTESPPDSLSPDQSA